MHDEELPTIFCGQIKPRVLNKYKDKIPKKSFGIPDSVYIGRPSKWGNPFQIGKDGNRDEVCDLYEKMVLSNLDFQEKIKIELRGKNLVCFCAPKRCHGDILLKIANE